MLTEDGLKKIQAADKVLSDLRMPDNWFPESTTVRITDGNLQIGFSLADIYLNLEDEDFVKFFRMSFKTAREALWQEKHKDEITRAFADLNRIVKEETGVIE